MGKVIDILRWICAIILAIGIIVLGLAQIVSSTIFSKRYVLSKFEETDYYINTYSQVNSDFENYIYQSGLNKGIIENLVTPEDIKEDTEIIISNIYDGKNAKIDLDKVKDRLRSNIQRNITEKNIWVRSQETIEKYVEVVSEQYNDSILHTDIEEKLFNGIEKAHTLVSKLTTISASMIGITTIIILTTCIKKYWRNMVMLGIPLVTSGAFYVFMQLYIKYRVDIKNIMILSEAITYTIRTIIFNILDIINVSGIIMAIIGFSLILTGNIIRANKHKHRN